MSAEQSQRPMTSPAPTPLRRPGLQLLPVTGLPEFRPGDDLAAAIAAAAPWLVDGDVLLVTSKVLSKVEGRLVPSPVDPEARDELRRKLIDEESVRLVAQFGRTKIVENRLGVVAAAAGVDASNVQVDEIALLPDDPDASARRLRADFAARGLDVGVVITDTQGRAWRLGVVDMAIGAAGVEVLADLRGDVDGHGNELVITQVAVGDELAAAGDLVKGKLAAVPVAVARGLFRPGTAPDPDAAGARSLIRARAEDLFRLGTDLAIEQGRREAVLLRRTVRAFTGEPVEETVLARCVDIALTAPAPHHTRPVRFVWVREHRQALLEAMQAAWEADLADDGWPPERIARRTARGQVLREATEIVIPFITGDGRHDYPDAAAPRRRTHDVHRGRRRRGPGVAGRPGRRRAGFGLDLVDHLLSGRRAGRARRAGRLGAAGGGRYRPPTRRPGAQAARRRRAGAAVSEPASESRPMSLHAEVSSVLRAGRHRIWGRVPCGRRFSASWPPDPTPPTAPANPGTSRPAPWCCRPTGATCC